MIHELSVNGSAVVVLEAVLWLLGGLVQLLFACLIIREYRWAYGTRPWRQAWGLFFVSVITVLGHLALIARVGDTPLIEAIAWLLKGTLLSLAVWKLSTVFHHKLPDVDIVEGTISVDANSVILNWGPGMQRIMGWSAGEVVGKTLMETIMPPQAWEAHRAGVARFLATDSPELEERTLAMMAITKEGPHIPVIIRVLPILDTDGTWQFHARVQRLIPL